jgi:hypothetical protein
MAKTGNSTRTHRRPRVTALRCCYSRSSRPTEAGPRRADSELDLLRYAECIFYLDPEVADRAFQLRVA